MWATRRCTFVRAGWERLATRRAFQMLWSVWSQARRTQKKSRLLQSLVSLSTSADNDFQPKLMVSWVFRIPLWGFLIVNSSMKRIRNPALQQIKYDAWILWLDGPWFHGFTRCCSCAYRCAYPLECNKHVVPSCVYRRHWCLTVNQCCSDF